MQKHATRKKGLCRFDLPRFPMKKTLLRTSLNLLDFSKASIDVYRSKGYEIKKHLDLYKYEKKASVKDLLQKLSITYIEYTLRVCATLKADKIFLKRSPYECRINSYNKDLLNSWQANMEIQFCLDPWAVVNYIVKYMCKGQRGISA